MHAYRPRGAAVEVLHRRDAEVLLNGPAGTGKSRGCLEKLNLLAMLNPGMRGLMVRKTAVSLTSTGLVTFREKVVPELLAAGRIRWYGGSQQEAAGYRYDNGSFLAVGGMDKPSKIMSSEYDVVYVQEATELTTEDWEAITTRLRNGVISFQQIIADTNPDRPTHWLKQRVDRGDTVMLESRHEDNPVLFDEHRALGERPKYTVTERGRDYLSKLDKLTGVRYQRLRKGLWVAAEGLVFEDYDPRYHLVDRFDIPATWTRWWSVDFGYTNPFVCQMWAEDPDGRLYLYREIYRTKRTVDQHARDILDAVSTADPDAPDDLRRRTWREPKPRGIVCDHDAEGRAVLSREVGIGTIAAKKARKAGATGKVGIEEVQRRLRRAGDGQARLFILRDSVVSRDQDLVEAKLPASTEEEIVGYVWKRNPDGTTAEEPVKEHDHGMDPMRYLCAERDIGSPRIRTM